MKPLTEHEKKRAKLIEWALEQIEGTIEAPMYDPAYLDKYRASKVIDLLIDRARDLPENV